MFAVVCGKESVGEILSVNYLFYGSQEYHTQQSLQLNRIFHESFLSFWACLRERLCVWLPGRTTAAFLIHWTTDNPREPSPLSPACRREQSGFKFRPRYGFVDPEFETPLCSPKPNLTIHINHTATKRISTQIKPCLFYFPSSLCNLLQSLLFLVKKYSNKHVCGGIGVYCSQQAADRWSHSAEHIEQSMVLSISVASFVVVQCRVTGYSLHIDSAPSCHVTTMCCALSRVYLYPLHRLSSGFME